MSDTPFTLKIRFEDAASAEQGRAAQELANLLEQRLAGQGLQEQASVKVRRDRSDTQDFGATLLLVLGTPAALAIAKGVHDWIAKRGSRVVIETPEGTVVAVGDGAKNIDVAKTVAALSRKA